jgi:hypothetical protein
LKSHFGIEMQDGWTIAGSLKLGDEFQYLKLDDLWSGVHTVVDMDCPDYCKNERYSGELLGRNIRASNASGEIVLNLDAVVRPVPIRNQLLESGVDA